VQGAITSVLTVKYAEFIVAIIITAKLAIALRRSVRILSASSPLNK
jgi:archaellum component FlaG (FlaF/FlaG flagellin family)